MHDYTVSSSKAYWRKKVLSSLREYKNKKEDSVLLISKLKTEIASLEYDYILSYYPLLSTEPDTRPLLEMENTLLPFIENGKMGFALPKGLHQSELGFIEPEHTGIEFNNALIIIPVVAIDKDGYRLGRGGGFYDRYVAENKSKLSTVALVFPPSLVNSFGRESHDLKISRIITV